VGVPTLFVVVSPPPRLLPVRIRSVCRFVSTNPNGRFRKGQSLVLSQYRVCFSVMPSQGRLYASITNDATRVFAGGRLPAALLRW
jgi:hypothetical protein